MKAINFMNVKKDFKEYTALSGLTAQFDQGCFYGIYGRENSGKTTLVSLAGGRIMPDSGTVLADGQPILTDDALMSQICCSAEARMYPKLLKVSSAVKAMKRLYPNFSEKYAYQLLADFKISPDDRIKSLSDKQQPLLNALLALSSGAEFTFLDEPVKQLDDLTRRRFYAAAAKKFESDGKTICLATHLVAETAGFITHVAMINDGRLICRCPVEFFTKNGYSVKGKRGIVDDYTIGKKVFGSVMNGDRKTAFVLGVRPISSDNHLSFSKLNLEVVFAEMTGTAESEEDNR